MNELIKTLLQTPDCPSDREAMTRELLNTIHLTWSTFGNHLTPQQRAGMVTVWGVCVDRYPLKLLKMTLALENNWGRLWPPQSPGQLLQWVERDFGIKEMEFCYERLPFEMDKEAYARIWIGDRMRHKPSGWRADQ